MPEPTLSVDEQLRIVRTGAVDVITDADFRRKLGTGRSLRIKLGIDPTASDIHLGFAVVLRKLRQFQELGHTAVLIIGGFTAQVGDPSGRSTTRPRLTAEEVAANAATYLAQAGRVLLPEPLEVVDNGDWLAPMTLPDVLELTAQMTVARMLERSDFATRYREGRPIAILEFLYPLLQGRDSVAVRADVELGGTDQTFNLLVGRTLQEAAGQEPQTVLTMPLIEGTDGVAKMSKTAGNTIELTDDPPEMFGKVMRLRDELLVKYLRLVTDVPPEEVDRIAAGLADGSLHPGEQKRRLAREVVTGLYDAGAAGAAEARFNRQFVEHAIPEDLPEYPLGDAESVFLPALLTNAGLAASGSQARQLVSQGGVRLDGEVLDDPTAELKVTELRGRVLQVGRRRFVRLG